MVLKERKKKKFYFSPFRNQRTLIFHISYHEVHRPQFTFSTPNFSRALFIPTLDTD